MLHRNSIVHAMCYCYHDEISQEKDGHEDDDHQVVQSRECPLGRVVKTCPLFLFIHGQREERGAAYFSPTKQTI